MKVAGRRLGGSGGVAAGGGDGEARCPLVFVPGCWAGCARHPPALPRDCSRSEPPGMCLFGPFSSAGAAPPPRFALKRSEPVQLRPLPGSALPAFPLAAGGKLRSGFPAWVYPAEPGFGRKPREGFWQGESCVPWHGSGYRCAGSGRAPGGTGDLGSTRLERAASGTCGQPGQTFGTLGCVPAPVGVTDRMSHGAQEDPPGRVDWDREAEEGSGGC